MAATKHPHRWIANPQSVWGVQLILSHYCPLNRAKGTDFFVYHVIQDISSEKVYAIAEHSVSARFQIDFKTTRLLKQDIENGKKVWKDVNYNDTGSFWIDKEIKDCCHIEDDKVIINYFEEHKVKIASELFHRNPAYDVSLFSNAIFITGHAEFDVSKE